MKIISPVLLFLLFISVSGQNDTTTTEATTPTTLDTTIETTTTSAVTEVTTTTPSSTTSSSTTSSSTSTTSLPTTSSPAPSTQVPGPEKCPFNVTEGNLTCIRADLKAEFIIESNGQKYTVMLGCGASTSASDCTSSNETQTLVLTEPTHALTMIFEKKAGKVLVQNVTFSYNLPEGPRGTVANNTEDLFGVKSGNSYMCKSKLDIHLENVTMEIDEVHIQAFIEEGKEFGATEECEADEKVSDIVPIAVGVALAALIIIVLIAYLVGRRRSRQKGYQSV